MKLLEMAVNWGKGLKGLEVEVQLKQKNFLLCFFFSSSLLKVCTITKLFCAQNKVFYKFSKCNICKAIFSISRVLAK